MAYKSLADFATDAIREKCEKLGIFLPKPELLVLEHFNVSEGVCACSTERSPTREPAEESWTSILDPREYGVIIVRRIVVVTSILR